MRKTPHAGRHSFLNFTALPLLSLMLCKLLLASLLPKDLKENRAYLGTSSHPVLA
jgi:hypothetical protein